MQNDDKYRLIKKLSGDDREEILNFALERSKEILSGNDTGESSKGENGNFEEK